MEFENKIMINHGAVSLNNYELKNEKSQNCVILLTLMGCLGEKWFIFIKLNKRICSAIKIDTFSTIYFFKHQLTLIENL